MASNKPPFSLQEAIETIEKEARDEGIEQTLCDNLHTLATKLAQDPKHPFFSTLCRLFRYGIWKLSSDGDNEGYPWSEDSEPIDPEAMRAAADAARSSQNFKLAFEIVLANKVPQSADPKLVLGEEAKEAHGELAGPSTEPQTNENEKDLKSEVQVLVADVHQVSVTTTSQSSQVEGIPSRLTATEKRLGMDSESLE
ncbi:hypothetical protein GL218_07821 [Daldinia childiae]|uniref:uncharacterized protein n=1 Tax=Daldinia childiae TaxID=326645 RepID=UPI00144729EA|nr:uncharacterized protein GL218_07821 [Daldinia childiae]KAF3069856.1 hypothetical protein GL218_07821 [Daldinia childiae]